ncbi:MAG: hypothetical protein ACI9Z3_000704, partial [Roseivirga sp.]
SVKSWAWIELNPTRANMNVNSMAFFIVIVFTLF